jgi:hypothetical protein
VSDLQDLKVDGITWSGEGWGTVNYRQGGRVVQFYDREVVDPVESAKHGRPRHKLVTHMRSFIPGEQRYEVADRPATRADAQRYPREWNAYVQGKEAIPEGTLLNAMFPYKPDVVRNLAGYHIYTVEQLANLSATSIDSIGMGCQSWVNEAKRYLEVTSKGASLSQVRRELEERDSRIRTLENTIEQLQGQITAVMQQSHAQVAATPQTIDPALLQQIIAQVQGAQGARPTMPAQPASQVFDAQTAQINATHATAQIRKTRRKSGGK